MPKRSPPQDPRLALAGNPAMNLPDVSSLALLAECKRRFGHQLVFLSTEELVAEIKRRSIGCMIVQISAGEGNYEQWQTAIKGSNFLVGAMSVRLERALHLDRQWHPEASA